MIRTVKLYGDLAKKYGSNFNFDIDHVREAVSALCANFKGFRQDFRDGFYQVIIGKKDSGLQLDEGLLEINLGNQKEIHIIPVPLGAKSQRQASTMKIVAGLALLIPFGVGIVAGLGAGAAASASALGGLVTAGGMAKVGLSLALSGAASMLSPTPKVGDYGNRERPEERPSFLFNGATNTSTQGLPIPLVYGRFRVGSIVISSGLQAEQI